MKRRRTKPPPNERWRAIKGFEGLYEVSDFGRIKSLKRKIKNKIMRKIFFYLDYDDYSCPPCDWRDYKHRKKHTPFILNHRMCK